MANTPATPQVKTTREQLAEAKSALAALPKDAPKADQDKAREAVKVLVTKAVKEEIARIEAIIVAPENAKKPGKKAAARRQANKLRAMVGMPELVSAGSSSGQSDTTPTISDNDLAFLA